MKTKQTKKETIYQKIKASLSGGVSLNKLEKAQYELDCALAGFKIREKDAQRLYGYIGSKRAWLFRVFGFISDSGIMEEENSWSVVEPKQKV